VVVTPLIVSDSIPDEIASTPSMENAMFGGGTGVGGTNGGAGVGDGGGVSGIGDTTLIGSGVGDSEQAIPQAITMTTSGFKMSKHRFIFCRLS